MRVTNKIKKLVTQDINTLRELSENELLTCIRLLQKRLKLANTVCTNLETERQELRLTIQELRHFLIEAECR